jgi:selenocysteine lyase/cysteine desulfurase
MQKNCRCKNEICAAANQVGALSFVDAVHFAAHHSMDVRAWGCTFAVCSPYKFFGPHSGVLFGRRSHLESAPVEKLDLAGNELPCDTDPMSRWELGTQSFESLAGVAAAVEYLASLGSRFGAVRADASRRQRICSGWRAIEDHEDDLKAAFLSGVDAMRTRGCDVRILGVREVGFIRERTPTFAIHKAGCSPEELVAHLVKQNVWCTSGNHYASLWTDHSGGLATSDGGGMARLGFLHYNTVEEVEYVLKVLREC